MFIKEVIELKVSHKVKYDKDVYTFECDKYGKFYMGFTTKVWDVDENTRCQLVIFENNEFSIIGLKGLEYKKQDLKMFNHGTNNQ